jgi:hypothetical protein
VTTRTVERAVNDLVHEGLLETVPRKGTFVRRNNGHEPDTAAELRVSFEPASNTPPTAKERSRLTSRFLAAARGCRLTVCDLERADAPYLPLDILPAHFDEFEDIEELALSLYGRTKPPTRQGFDCLRWKGQLKLLPVDWRVNVAFVSLELFERVGLPPPSADWDMATFLDSARRAYRPEAGQYGYATVIPEDQFLSLLWQNDGHVFDATGMACRLAEAEGIEAADLFRELHRWAPPTAGGHVQGATELTGLFCEGNLALLTGNCWNYVHIKREARCRFAVLPLPRGRCSASALSVDGCAIRCGASARRLTDLWLGLLADMEKWPDHIEHHPGIPLHADIEEPPDVLAAFEASLRDGKTFLSDIEAGSRSERQLQCKRLLEPALQRLLMEETASTRILANLRDQVNALLTVSRHSSRSAAVSAL